MRAMRPVRVPRRVHLMCTPIGAGVRAHAEAADAREIVRGFAGERGVGR